MQRESEVALDFVRNAKFRDYTDAIVSQQRFIATMQGRTAAFSTFSDGHFDEAAFEVQLTANRSALIVFFYWIMKLKARFLSGDYAEAVAAAGNAEPLLWAGAAHIQVLDYFYYTALAVAALYENADAEQQTRWRQLLETHREQLHKWVDNYSPTFADKHALVSAELARIEGREIDAMRLYEEAIRAARENGFMQNEGVANELAAQFYLKRGVEKAAHSYLRDARYCYRRWGAVGKVKQLDECYPAIEEQAALRSTTTIGTPVEQLDLATVMKASQAVAGEIVLEKLIKMLMMIALEHAGAERGLLILSYGEELRIVAKARTGQDAVDVQLQDASVTPSDLPNSLLHYVIRTQESVILDDASTQNRFSQDEYVRQGGPRSVLCLPLVKQVNMVGILYLENSLAPRVFTAKRLAMLEMLASQAAISLDHARLYADLGRLNAELTQENSDRRKAEEALRAGEQRWRNLFETSAAGIALISSDGRYLAANLALQKMLGYSEEELQRLGPLQLTCEEDRPQTEAILLKPVNRERLDYRIEKRYWSKDGKVIWADVSSTLVPATGDSPSFFAAVVVDITERKRAEEQLRQKEISLREAQTELAHVSRVTTLGELSASIAHEVKQPLAGIMTNANASLRWLAGELPNLNEAREAIVRIIRDGNRANDVVSRMRALFKKAYPAKERFDINAAIEEVAILTQREARKNQVALRMELAADLPAVMGDPVQLQQVVMNLILNGIEAMSTVEDRDRDLVIRTQRGEGDEVRVAVQDSGIGFDPQNAERMFDAFHTTKPGGLGMGLSISRSIVESHGGRLWAVPNDGPGATFQFTFHT